MPTASSSAPSSASRMRCARGTRRKPTDKDSRLLAPGRPLEEARELLSRPHALIDDIRPFIKASIAHDDARVAEEQRRIEAEKQREIEQARKGAAPERGRRRAAVVGLVAALVLRWSTKRSVPSARPWRLRTLRRKSSAVTRGSSNRRRPAPMAGPSSPFPMTRPPGCGTPPRGRKGPFCVAMKA